MDFTPPPPPPPPAGRTQRPTFKIEDKMQNVTTEMVRMMINLLPTCLISGQGEGFIEGFSSKDIELIAQVLASAGLPRSSNIVEDCQNIIGANHVMSSLPRYAPTSGYNVCGESCASSSLEVSYVGQVRRVHEASVEEGGERTVGQWLEKAEIDINEWISFPDEPSKEEEFEASTSSQ